MSPHQNGQQHVINGSTKARNILKLTKDEKQKLLESFDIVLSDCDGVIWMICEPIAGTGPAIMLLKNAGKQFKFVSNNSMRNDQEYLQKLAAIGVENVEEVDLVHPVKTITRYLKTHMPDQPIFSLCSAEVVKQFRENGIEVKTMKPHLCLRTEELEANIAAPESVAAVVLDLNFNLTFGELARAQQYLLREDCRLLVGASDVFLPVSRNIITICVAGFMKMLEEASGKAPIILGKPGALLSADLIKQFQITDPSRALFIGDNLITDIRFGLDAGFQTLFVLTGATTCEQMLALPDELKPDYVANSLADFVEFFSDLT